MQRDWGAMPELPERNRGFRWAINKKTGWHLNFEFMPKGSGICGKPKVNSGQIQPGKWANNPTEIAKAVVARKLFDEELERIDWSELHKKHGGHDGNPSASAL
jgi:hypothetical protein